MSDEHIQNLSRNLTIPKERLGKLSFFNSCDHFYNQTGKTAQVKWVMPLGVRSKGKHLGLQYCPCCLIEDGEKPYFRKHWRLGFLTSCPFHSVQLHDHCPECGAAVDLKRLKKRDKAILYEETDIVHCSNCGFDLRESKYTVASPAENQINRLHFSMYLNGYGTIGNQSFNYSNLYFEGLRRLLSFIACSPKGKKLFMHLRSKLELNQVYHREIVGHNVEPERIEIGIRRTGLLMIYYLLQKWPDNFIADCKDSGVTSHLIKTPYLEFPFWVCDALFFYICENKYLASPEEKRSIIEYAEKHLKKSINERQVARFVGYYF